MITTTLNRIRAHGPCGLDPRRRPLTGYQKLVAGLGPDHGPDDPIPFSKIVEINGLDDAMWCCRAEPQHAKTWWLFAVWCARQVQHLMTDPRSIAAIDVAERHANGLATDEELTDAQTPARFAAYSTPVGHKYVAVWAAARAAARAAAGAAAEAAAWAAVLSEGDAARAAQAAKFIEMVDAA